MPVGGLLMQDVPALIMLIVGFALLVLEMYIPGFGAPGIIGSFLTILGIALWAQTFVQALVLALIMLALLCIALSLSMRMFAKGRILRSKLVLKQVSNAPSLTEKDMKFFVGRAGVAKTVLRPSGVAEFDGVKLSVVSDGEFISAGAAVRVERVEGNRIVVSEAG